MMNKYSINKILLTTLLLLYAGVQGVFAQQKLKFSVADFDYDAFDTTAKDDRYKKVDGSGSLYAIIKVSSASPDENQREYNFNFGNMNSFVENHDDQLWVYVQKNAKMVTISRNGYTTLRNYDLHTTIEAGKTYKMVLSAQGPVVYTQMLMFKVSPADSKAVVMIREEGSNSEGKMLGIADASGVVAKNMPFGTYTYRVVSEDYNSSEGRITLNNQEETHQEEVTLRPRFSQITLTVNDNAEIYVNGERKGSGSWTGRLNAGMYQVECRCQNHRSSTQSITVEENTPRTIELTPPTPIVGTLSVISSPVGASIQIDGKDYGKTPRNITGLLIGRHEVTLNLDGYDETRATAEVKENETSELNLSLSDVSVSFQKAEELYENKEYSQAVEYFQRLAGQGHAEAQNYLGWCYQNGNGVSQDYQKAIELYEKAANKGNAMAQNNLGWCYDTGNGVSQDYKKAVELYEKSANQGLAMAQCNLGYCYENGDGVEQDMRKAFEWYEKAAIQGYARAQHNLGVCLSNGEGVDKDPKKAFEWYEKAAVQGFALSQHNLGNFYSNGIVVDKDVRKAIEWWEKAAIQGYAGSQHNIGFCYYNGEGVEKNLNKAFYWYEKAANQGYPDSQYATGYCYNYGEGVNKDHKKAFEWYEKAANQGHAVAQNNLGACYEDGIGVAKDLKKAFEWYEKSANQGVAIAQKNLELCYEYGKGVAKDLQKAAYWKKKYEENPNK